MSKNARLSKQLWQLSMVSVMGLNLVGIDLDDSERRQMLSGDLLLDMGAEELDYEDHRELFTGPAAMGDVAERDDDWGELSDGPVITHVEDVDSLRAELGLPMHARFENDAPVYGLWDESWETAASAEDAFA